jgi:hypothetical protein
MSRGFEPIVQHMACRRRGLVDGGPRIVGVGLESTEMVLRGGYLKNPVVLKGLTDMDGRVFVPLRKMCPMLSDFLTESPCFKRPLANTTVFENLMKLRNAKVRMLKRDIQLSGADVADEVSDRAEGALDDLGLDDLQDAPDDVTKVAKRSRAGAYATYGCSYR